MLPTWVRERIRKGMIAKSKQEIKALRKQQDVSTIAERNRIEKRIKELNERIEKLEGLKISTQVRNGNR